jgi:formylglycine-generating enzyme required for sulfatase activity
MGDDAKRIAELDGPQTQAAEEIARTWFGDSAVSVKGDAAPREATSPTERPPAPAPAGRFTMVREIGRGGMGRVDEVFDSVLGRAVAQKSVLPGASFLQTTLLVSEAQTCAQLEHPSIVPVYDFGPSADHQPQYTMRLVRGRTLGKVLDDRAQTLAQRLGVLRQVCLAVAYAHTRGVVHRDLKPDNVICGEFGEVYVLDWGIAHLVEGSDVKRAKHEEVQAGSPGYMAPEQVLAKKITPGTDVFALGAMLYEIVTGKRAFADESPASILRRCQAGIDAPPSRRDPRAPAAFDSLVVRCLSPEADDRPSARDVADAIDAFLDGERARTEREREAESFTTEGEEARAAFEQRRDEVRRLREESEKLLEEIPLWESAEKKDPAWKIAARADDLAKEAARDLARAQTAFARALGRVPNHVRARRGLASLHYRLFESAESDGDADTMAQHLELARAYDDGDLALELANEGVLIVEPSTSALLTVARYERDGLRLVLGEEKPFRAGTRVALDAGSYLVRARPTDRESEVIRYPLVIRRAKLHRLKLRIPSPGEVPEGMVVIPGGPFLGAANVKATRMVEKTLPDFAIGVFPVTWREYSEFLEALDEHERQKRHPHNETACIVRAADGSWSLTSFAVEGEARARIPAGSELDIPAAYISFFDAVACAGWRARKKDRPLRLASELEWEKALRGADGRRFSMGDELDPSFARLRESRREHAQPEVIGAFPLDESPYGVRDLTGNVGDWTGTMADGAPPPSERDEGNPEIDSRQVVYRGGCYGTTALFAHGMRYTTRGMERLGWVGFRLALSLDAHGSSDLVIEAMRRR